MTCLRVCAGAAGGQETREEASEARKAAGVHPVPICEFEMETHQGDKFTQDDLKGSFSILMFGDSVSNHALQGLAKMQEIVVEQGMDPFTNDSLLISPCILYFMCVRNALNTGWAYAHDPLSVLCLCIGVCRQARQHGPYWFTVTFRLH